MDVLTHELPHRVVPAGHDWHAPELQYWPTGHATPHAPQLVPLVGRYASHEVLLPSQSA